MSTGGLTQFCEWRAAAFPVPSKFASPSYPGFNNKPKSFQHQLVLITRLLLLHELSHFDPAASAGPMGSYMGSYLEDVVDPHTQEYKDMHTSRVRGTKVLEFVDCAALPAVVLADRFLLGWKVLARPALLSAGEYLALVRYMVYLTAVTGMDRHNTAWSALWQVQQQCAVCPALLDYEVGKAGGLGS